VPEQLKKLVPIVGGGFLVVLAVIAVLVYENHQRQQCMDGPGSLFEVQLATLTDGEPVLLTTSQVEVVYGGDFVSQYYRYRHRVVEPGTGEVLAQAWTDKEEGNNQSFCGPGGPGFAWCMTRYGGLELRQLPDLAIAATADELTARLPELAHVIEEPNDVQVDRGTGELIAALEDGSFVRVHPERLAAEPLDGDAVVDLGARGLVPRAAFEAAVERAELEEPRYDRAHPYGVNMQDPEVYAAVVRDLPRIQRVIAGPRVDQGSWEDERGPLRFEEVTGTPRRRMVRGGYGEPEPRWPELDFIEPRIVVDHRTWDRVALPSKDALVVMHDERYRDSQSPTLLTAAAEEGPVLWARSLAASTLAFAVVEGDQLIVAVQGCVDGPDQLRGLDTATGETVWQLDF